MSSEARPINCWILTNATRKPSESYSRAFSISSQHLTRYELYVIGVWRLKKPASLRTRPVSRDTSTSGHSMPPLTVM